MSIWKMMVEANLDRKGGVFQSLLFWMSIWKGEFPLYAILDLSVSILVVLDVDLEVMPDVISVETVRVSILVVLDVDLEDKHELIKMLQETVSILVVLDVDLEDTLPILNVG